MICPYCGYVDEKTPTPEIVRQQVNLGECPNCKKTIWTIPSSKKGEGSQTETVDIGEQREVILSDILIRILGGTKHVKSDDQDIDRISLDADGNPIYYFEIKERSNSINAYKQTQFPFAKITAGKNISTEKKIPVYIILKFLDCWACHKIDIAKAYQRGDAPFAPNYRPWQKERQRQVPVQLDVEADLQILKTREGCYDDFN